MYVCACMSCMVRITLSQSDPWGHCMILKFKGKNRQTGTINIGCDSKNRLQNILEVQNLCYCFSIEWSWFPNSGGTPALVGLALRGRGGEEWREHTSLTGSSPSMQTSGWAVHQGRSGEQGPLCSRTALGRPEARRNFSLLSISQKHGGSLSDKADRTA